jgi:hypothetical protein
MQYATLQDLEDLRRELTCIGDEQTIRVTQDNGQIIESMQLVPEEAPVDDNSIITSLSKDATTGNSIIKIQAINAYAVSAKSRSGEPVVYELDAKTWEFSGTGDVYVGFPVKHQGQFDIQWYSSTVTGVDTATQDDETEYDMAEDSHNRIALIRIDASGPRFQTSLTKRNVKLTSSFMPQPFMNYNNNVRELTFSSFGWAAQEGTTTNDSLAEYKYFDPITVPISTSKQVWAGLNKTSNVWEIVLGAKTDFSSTHYSLYNIGIIETDSSGKLVNLETNNTQNVIPVSGYTTTQEIAYNLRRYQTGKLIYTPRTLHFVAGTLVKYVDASDVIIDLT